jgi:hypothetical protein
VSESASYLLSLLLFWLVDCVEGSQVSGLRHRGLTCQWHVHQQPASTFRSCRSQWHKRNHKLCVVLRPKVSLYFSCSSLTPLEMKVDGMAWGKKSDIYVRLNFLMARRKGPSFLNGTHIKLSEKEPPARRIPPETLYATGSIDAVGSSAAADALPAPTPHAPSRRRRLQRRRRTRLPLHDVAASPTSTRRTPRHLPGLRRRLIASLTCAATSTPTVAAPPPRCRRRTPATRL